MLRRLNLRRPASTDIGLDGGRGGAILMPRSGAGMLQSTGNGDDEADVEAAGGEAMAGDYGGGCGKFQLKKCVERHHEAVPGDPVVPSIYNLLGEDSGGV